MAHRFRKYPTVLSDEVTVDDEPTDAIPVDVMAVERIAGGLWQVHWEVNGQHRYGTFEREPTQEEISRWKAKFK